MEVTTTYLEQLDPAEVKPAAEPGVPVEVGRAELPSPELNRYLYAAVGGDWFWIDRLTWTWQQWYDWLARPSVETWVATVRGTPVGYVELDGHQPGEVEIAYFGLLPAFLGQGIGGHLLTVGLRRAWSLAERWPGHDPVRRVWVHTCTMDGPAALANYQARGMRAYRTETEHTEVPAEAPGPWPGAQR
ncbi:MAG: GNAT family N-acetyltransferase [Micromonosporaceae bacterium]